jgi:hypothetical protein
MQQVGPDLHDAKSFGDLLPCGSYLTGSHIELLLTLDRVLGEIQLKKPHLGVEASACLTISLCRRYTEEPDKFTRGPVQAVRVVVGPEYKNRMPRRSSSGSTTSSILLFLLFVGSH